MGVTLGVTRRKLQTPGHAEEHKRPETPTINPIRPTDKPHRPSTKHYRKDSLGDALTEIGCILANANKKMHADCYSYIYGLDGQTAGRLQADVEPATSLFPLEGLELPRASGSHTHVFTVVSGTVNWQNPLVPFV